MSDGAKPLLLLADGAPLFLPAPRFNAARWAVQRTGLPAAAIRAAYIGAANGDEPAFYEMFLAAFRHVGVNQCVCVTSVPSLAQMHFLAQADIILLSGGDPTLGLRVMRGNGVAGEVARGYRRGALLIGISAGAVQFGRQGFEFLPVCIDAHDEPRWPALRDAVQRAGPGALGWGIPAGAALAVHPPAVVTILRGALWRMDHSGTVHIVPGPGET